MAVSTRDFAEKATWDEMAKKWLAYAQHYDRKSVHSFARKSFRKDRTRPPALDED